MKSKILNPERMKQLIDFKGLGLDGDIYPTDIDGLIEYHDKEYIIIEVSMATQKYPSASVLRCKGWLMTSQRLASVRLRLCVSTTLIM